MEVVRTTAEMRRRVADWRGAGERVGLVPTMGALHEGHMSLVHQASTSCARTIVTIFVNPTQFAPNEDFDSYPRDEDGDLSKLRAAGVDLVFAPGVEEMYAKNAATVVEVQGLGKILEGEFRPHFFAGVATVVAKLLIKSAPDMAIFGEKDYQQLCVIRTMARDLDLPVEIVGGETVREDDGLAMSSRNAYLSAEQRAVAPMLYKVIYGIAQVAARGGDFMNACAEGTQSVLDAGFKSVDYIVVRDAETLGEPQPGRPLRVLAAAWLGKTRLIDNLPV